ncbi:conserved hypothetical protein [Theileria orientalis strain Shintoku]|uniref:Uncharacterized protein n=1 Tax=Theileria orientalis strain Shintoku TaxID=869250 RepID=J4C8U8_THEOR|nr:conserved hypothetical protein [Theileria orientalis strain Shintoku]BAM41413.1 conserved hypothetical protein [Theileria orientalis strain Shintoku]|eukprot:XP_009691714.1 conserved hypothetical protein [Theileria orientalis strain Shintoku]
MVARGLFSLFLLFGAFGHLIKFIHARTNVLHDGVLDSLSYDPSLLSLLQMEQSLDLDDDETSYLGTSFLDNGSSFLQHSSKYLGPSYPDSSSSFLEDSSSLGDDDDEGDLDEGSLLDESDEWHDDSSFLENDDFADDRESSLLESSSSSRSQDDDDFGESFLQTRSSYAKPSSTFGSLVQLHNFDAADPLNFLQDDTLLLMNEDEQPDMDLEEESPRKSSVKAFVLRSDMEEPEGVEMSQSLDETTAEKVLSVLSAYKVWLIVLTVVLSIALVVRLFYLDKFLKFKTELWTRLETLNKVVVDKFNSVFRKNQTAAATPGETEETPLLSA